jgi:transposase
MATLEVFVGLDYHQSAVQVCILNRQGEQLANRSCANDSLAIGRLVQQFGTKVQVAIEACCGAANLAEELLRQWGWTVNLAHPGFVARMKQNPDKTDFSDARLLADLERVGYLPRVWLAPAEVQELRRLVRYRQQLAQERRNLKLRLGALLRDQRVPKADATPWTKKWLRWLQNEAPLSTESRWIVTQQLRRLGQVEADITAVEERLAQQTAEDAVVQQLLQEKGVGLVTAVTMRAEIGRFDRFRSGKQLARFCGLSPRNASSGERQADAGLIKAGNPQLRAVLIELAHRLMRYSSRWRELATTLRGKGKAGSVVAAAVANRWVRALHHQMQPAAMAA